MNSEALKGYNDLMILFLLLEKDSYGYEISKQIREKTHQQYIMKETTLYSVFDRLERMGYIESYYGTETFGKRRTYYKLTPEGRAYYTNKCAEWQETVDIVRGFIIENIQEGL